MTRNGLGRESSSLAPSGGQGGSFADRLRTLTTRASQAATVAQTAQSSEDEIREQDIARDILSKVVPRLEEAARS